MVPTPITALCCKGDETQRERQRVLYSQNAGNGLYPRLIVDFTVSNDTTPPYASVNGLPVYSKNPFVVAGPVTTMKAAIPMRPALLTIKCSTMSVVEAGLNGLTRRQTHRPNSVVAPTTRHTNSACALLTVPVMSSHGQYPSHPDKVDTVPPNVTMNSLPEYTFR